MPYLNRERPDIASVLLSYRTAEEGDPNSYFQKWRENCLESCEYNCTELCSFSYMLMRDSAQNLKRFIPQEYLDEMQGIADGAGLPFEKILILNTFFDTLMAFRAITFYIQRTQSPMIVSVSFLGADGDNRDNDGDGEIDQAGEGVIDPWKPGPVASIVEVPVDMPIKLRLRDIKLSIGTDKGDEPGVDPDTVRIRYNDLQFEYPKDNGVITMLPDPEDPEYLEVLFLPPGGFQPGAVEAVVVQAGDFNRISNPPPVRARFMRDERITFTTEGYGAAPWDVPNIGLVDDHSQPPSIAFAARSGATTGDPLLAHHFAMLDSNTAHEHTVLFMHIPDQGIPHMVLGYSGLVWGLSGMNAQGLGWSFATSDSLNNPMVGAFIEGLFEAHLTLSGTPIGILGRDLLSRNDNVSESVDTLENIHSTFGWNVLVADGDGYMAVVELDSNVNRRPAGGAFVIRPGDLSPVGLPLAGVGDDDLVVGSHFVKNLDDLTTKVLIFDIKPQRYWSSFYYRSVRARARLVDEVARLYGKLDVDGAINVLGHPELIDIRDSMIAAVYDLKNLRIRYAMGTVPATDGGFLEFDMAEALSEQVTK